MSEEEIELNQMGLPFIFFSDQSFDEGNSERLMKCVFSTFNQVLRVSVSWPQYAELINLGCSYSYSVAEIILWNMRYQYIIFYVLWIEYDIY